MALSVDTDFAPETVEQLPRHDVGGAEPSFPVLAVLLANRSDLGHGRKGPSATHVQRVGPKPVSADNGVKAGYGLPPGGLDVAVGSTMSCRPRDVNTPHCYFAGIDPGGRSFRSHRGPFASNA
jgi:hypothetical protein